MENMRKVKLLTINPEKKIVKINPDGVNPIHEYIVENATIEYFDNGRAEIIGLRRYYSYLEQVPDNEDDYENLVIVGNDFPVFTFKPPFKKMVEKRFLKNGEGWYRYKKRTRLRTTIGSGYGIYEDNYHDDE